MGPTARNAMDGVELGQQLMAAGMSAGAAEEKATLWTRCIRQARELGATGHGQAIFVPGRIEVLGKHTDYAGGRSLVAAVERGFCALAIARADQVVRMVQAGEPGQAVTFPLTPDLTPTPGSWANYPMTVARRLARNFPGLRRGADLVFASDLPAAAGMSSSSALVVLTYLGLARANALAERTEYQANIRTPEELAGYLGTLENGQTYGTLTGDRGVGTFGGSEDHTAILCAQAGRLSQYAYCPVRRERTLAVPAGYRFAIAVSGVVAEKTGAARARYNRAAELAATVAEVWRTETQRDDRHLAAVVASAEGAAQVRKVLTHAASSGKGTGLIERFDQFFAESEEIIPAAGDALAAGKLEAFGHWVDRSQNLAEHGLGNQVPETIFLAQTARQAGAAAASAFGAGFGGSVWALVQNEAMEAFLKKWNAGYRTAFPEAARHATFFATGAGPGARVFP